MDITRHTRVGDILARYGDIADVREALDELPPMLRVAVAFTEARKAENSDAEQARADEELR